MDSSGAQEKNCVRGQDSLAVVVINRETLNSRHEGQKVAVSAEESTGHTSSCTFKGRDKRVYHELVL